MEEKKSCCQPKEANGLKQGIIFGLLPHSFCIGFIVLSVLGVALGTVIFRKILLVPYLFQILVGLSFVLATISAIIYLKKCGLLSVLGIKRKWRYLLVLYGATIGINLLFFLVIFPKIANLNLGGTKVLSERSNYLKVNLSVDIPCSGHATLITDELKKIKGVGQVIFKSPNIFEVSYDHSQVTLEQILGAEVFKTFKAEILNS